MQYPYDLVFACACPVCVLFFCQNLAAETSKAAGKKKVQPQSTPTPVPTASDQASSSGMGSADTAAIWAALQNAQKAIAELQQQKDAAYQAGLDKAAELFEAANRTKNRQ